MTMHIVPCCSTCPLCGTERLIYGELRGDNCISCHKKKLLEFAREDRKEPLEKRLAFMEARVGPRLSPELKEEIEALLIAALEPLQEKIDGLQEEIEELNERSGNE